MKITKYVHSCLLVETADRAALFDPGIYSARVLSADSLPRLDDIFITHIHPDHCDVDFIKQLVAKFPNVRIATNSEVVAYLKQHEIVASDQPPTGVKLFEAPHEGFAPLMPQPPQCVGFHLLDQLSHPGDSHSFRETKPILALPMQAPWGSTMRAAQLASELKPQHILPIHDWHWNDEARAGLYDSFTKVFAEQGITFHKLETGIPVEIPA